MTPSPETTPSTASQPDQSGPRDAAADTDPLLHLHKMSTTAGVGSQDYVAVNVTAIVAVLFGLASLLAIVDDILLIIPVIGVILAWMALRQIRDSNGTQTGKGLAILGLALSGIITVVIFSVDAVSSLHRRSDQRAIAGLCEKYGDLLARKDFDQAYDLFDSDFKARVNQQVFKIHLTSIQQGTMVPPIDGITWNGVSPIFHTQDGFETADAVIKLHYPSIVAEQRATAHFRRDGDGPWLIDNIPEQFPALSSRAPANP